MNGWLTQDEAIATLNTGDDVWVDTGQWVEAGIFRRPSTAQGAARLTLIGRIQDVPMNDAWLVRLADVPERAERAVCA